MIKAHSLNPGKFNLQKRFATRNEMKRTQKRIYFCLVLHIVQIAELPSYALRNREFTFSKCIVIVGRQQEWKMCETKAANMIFLSRQLAISIFNGQCSLRG